MKDFTVIFEGEIYTVKAKYFIISCDTCLFYDDKDVLVSSVPTSAFIF